MNEMYERNIRSVWRTTLTSGKGLALVDRLRRKLPGSAKCCGCSACHAACFAGAISMLPDEEGFLQPVVDGGKCIGCGKCEKVCPVLDPGLPRNPLSVYAAKAKDDALRRISSSGGMFSLLAREVLKKGGVVYGAAFETHTHRVIHQSAENEEELDALRGSKYVQSDMGDVFRKVKTDLDAERKVLFSGCPCQIAGLRRFLGKEYDNLLLVDVICHAAPSPLAWKKYLSCQEHKAGTRILRTFSRRNCPWRKYSLSFEFAAASGGAYVVNPASDTYQRAFCTELFNRKCCHHCAFRSFKSGSDITIGDFWGVEKAHSEINDDIGVSAVCCNTRKGKDSFVGVIELTKYVQSSIDVVATHNKAIIGNHRINRKRVLFFSEVSDTNFDELVEMLLTPPWWYRTLRWIKWHTIGKPEES